ncbi:MAG TPA: cytochrome c biogenesis protein CcdA [Beutenbergiaceae bacterium]|nr:cytochrome c biogenesis protein CcdA [Beutenbergiaceae bacterium]
MGWLEQLGADFAQTIYSGPMLAALPIALLAGFISFASPCVLPLVPGYVGYISGMSGADILGTAENVRRSRVRLVAGVSLFILGFTAVFVLLTMALSTAGLFLVRWQDLITRLLGVLVVVLGVAFIGRIPFLQRQRRLQINPKTGVLGAPVLGVVFGLGWTPCMGPTLAAVLALAHQAADPGRALVLVIAYCLGLGVPFVMVAMGLKSSERMMGFLRRHRVVIMRIGGVMLVLIGLALVTGLWGALTQWMQGYIAGFETII